MKFNASLLGFVSTALVLSLSFGSSATASSVVVRRSELSNRAVQPQNYVPPIVARATSSAEALQDYAEVALKSQPAPTKSELFSGLAKNLNKQTKKPLQSLYNHLDVAEPAVKDLKADVNDVYAIIKDLTAAFSSIAQDGSVTGQKIDDNDSAALKKSLEKISTHFNYIKTTPKLNQFEKAQIFAGNGDAFKNVLNALKDQVQNLLNIVDTTVSGLVLDLLTPINALINLIVYFI